jgi:hypothetical protein
MDTFAAAKWEQALKLLRAATIDSESCADETMSSRALEILLGNKQESDGSVTLRRHPKALLKKLVQQMQVQSHNRSTLYQLL